jgi:pimeloyl-ACP methyl ester carboxylesterase
MTAVHSVTVAPGRSAGATVHGEGRPAVVFEAGMGTGRSSWALVVPLVAERTTAVTYDRAGIGTSPAVPAVRPVLESAADLLALIDGLGLGAAVVVAHSFGALIARAAAEQAPDRVAGLVLVDPTDEGCDLYFTPAQAKQSMRLGRMLPGLARVGLLRLAVGIAARPLARADRRTLVAESATVGAARTHAGELAACEVALRALRGSGPASVPVTVISGTKLPGGRRARSRREALIAAHARRASAAIDGHHVRAERAAHFVMFTEPEVVAAEALRMADAVRG